MKRDDRGIRRCIKDGVRDLPESTRIPAALHLPSRNFTPRACRVEDRDIPIVGSTGPVAQNHRVTKRRTERDRTEMRTQIEGSLRKRDSKGCVPRHPPLKIA